MPAGERRLSLRKLELRINRGRRSVQQRDLPFPPGATGCPGMPYHSSESGSSVVLFTSEMAMDELVNCTEATWLRCFLKKVS
jgi:hypothetical protein